MASRGEAGTFSSVESLREVELTRWVGLVHIEGGSRLGHIKIMLVRFGWYGVSAGLCCLQLFDCNAEKPGLYAF